MSEDNKVKQFNELTEKELEDLEKQRKERSKREGRDLLEDVVCLYVPELWEKKCKKCGEKVD